MAIGPLEFMVIGCPGDRFSSKILPELSAIQAKGLIEVVDLLFIRKATDDAVTVLEVNDLDNEEQATFDPIKSNLTGVITHQDIAKLASAVPTDTSAAIVLLEHLWLSRLEQAVEKAEGTVYLGGMVPPVALQQLETELATIRRQNHAQQNA